MTDGNTDKGRILLVDDDTHLLVTLGDFLKFEGFDVSTAASGEEALEKIKDDGPPELIILDICMPGMGGLGFLKAISGEEEKPPYPVLVFTARSAMEEFFDTLAVDGFLAKPCPEGQILRRVREIMARSGPDVRSRTTRQTLIVEAGSTVAARISEELERAGFGVHVARSSSEALEAAALKKPDVILINENLPGARGSAVASLIRALPALRTALILLYDEKQKIGEDRSSRYYLPRGVDKVIASEEPGVLVRAVSRLLAGVDEA